MTIKVGLVGCGTVGQGIVSILETHKERIKTHLGEDIQLAGILVKDLNKTRDVPPHTVITTNIEQLFNLEIDVVIEAVVGKEAGFVYCKKAIERGCHVITANKEMFASKGNELKHLAQHYNVSLGYEATTVAGTPIVRTLQQLFQVNRVEKVEGILNGTSNYILTKMQQENIRFDEALREAQSLGFAEADPSNDIDGNDAFYKAMILSELAYGRQPEWKDVYVEGIRATTPQHIEQASLSGRKIKQIATLEWKDDDIRASIQPISIHEDHPLYGIDGVQNGVVVHTDLAGIITLAGPGAGSITTASAVIEDLIVVYQQENKRYEDAI